MTVLSEFEILSKIISPFDNVRHWPIISQNGRYWLRFYFNGAYRCVIIDDRLPISNSDRTLHIIDRNNPSLLWPALLEKAYLQIWGGYDFLGSNSNTDLFIISSWIPELVILSEYVPSIHSFRIRRTPNVP
jgi:calpain-7